LDHSLNLMTLGGLALGVGMLVDNAIVTLENIHRLHTMPPGARAPSAAAAKSLAR
jgi:HAE1 family hydrophobic/amphiphilic exporter-1